MAQDTTDKTVVDPLQAFDTHRKRRQLQKELDEYCWTLPEVEALQAAGREDVNASREYQSLLGYIEASKARGDFKDRTQFTRSEAVAHMGLPEGTEIFSTGEIRAITQSDELRPALTDAMNQAQRENRIWNPAKGEPVHFAGESLTEGTSEFATFDKEIDGKLGAVAAREKMLSIITETENEFSAVVEGRNLPERHGKRYAREYLERQVKKVIECQHPRCSPETIPGYTEINNQIAALQSA